MLFTPTRFEEMASRWNVSVTGRCLDGRHLDMEWLATNGARSELGVMGGCFEPASWAKPRYVAPVECGASRLDRRREFPPPQPPRTRLPRMHSLTISLNSTYPDPIIHVVIRGNCRRVELDASSSVADTLGQARRCVRETPHAGCSDAVCSFESGCATFTGQFIQASTKMPLSRQLGGASASSAMRYQTLSLLDAGFCERCSAPSSSHIAHRVTLLRAKRLTSGRVRLGQYALEYLVEFEPRVPGPHLVYARLDYGSEKSALAADSTNVGWRGAFVGMRVMGSPFTLDVVPNERRAGAVLLAAPERTCVLADFADLSDVAMIATDDELLSLPRSKWVLTPRGCRMDRHRIGCSDGEPRCRSCSSPTWPRSRLPTHRSG